MYHDKPSARINHLHVITPLLLAILDRIARIYVA
nr:MAG TPA: hypothetical protein [Caudoviricetes sp.]